MVATISGASIAKGLAAMQAAARNIASGVGVFVSNFVDGPAGG